MISIVDFHRVERRMTEGAHKPPLVLASDGHRYVLKLGHQDRDFPACELVASLLAHAMGIATPAVALVRLSDAVVAAARADTAWSDLAEGQRDGLCFGSRYLGDHVLRWMPDLAPATRGMPEAAAGLLAFDLLIENHDRKLGPNPNVLWCDGALVAIDHGQSLPSVQGVTIGVGEIDVTAHAVWSVLQGATDGLGAWSERLPDDAAIDAAVAAVPPGWWAEPGRPEAVVAALRRRREAVRAMLLALRTP